MTDQRISVMSYAGYRGEETPRSFVFEGTQINVAQIVDRWLEEDAEGTIRRRCFKVKGSDGITYEIHTNEETHEWFGRKP